jgi:hypothetical protein
VSRALGEVRNDAPCAEAVKPSDGQCEWLVGLSSGREGGGPRLLPDGTGGVDPDEGHHEYRDDQQGRTERHRQHDPQPLKTPAERM